MGQSNFSDPQITINNENILIVPGSFKLIPGLGEDSVMTVSAGNGSIDIVTGRNVETQKSQGAFDVKSTKENKALVKKFKKLRGQLVISATEDSDIETVRQASITNDPEFAYSYDGNVTVEFEGLPSR